MILAKDGGKEGSPSSIHPVFARIQTRAGSTSSFGLRLANDASMAQVTRSFSTISSSCATLSLAPHFSLSAFVPSHGSLPLAATR
jgi:hypothetical protein